MIYISRITLTVLLLSVFYVPGKVQGQTGWTLEACIDYALKNNIRVKQQKLNVKLSESQVMRSKANFLPDLGGGAEHMYSFGYSVDPYTNDFTTDNVQSNNFYIRSQVTLFRGLQNHHQYKKNQLDLMATINDVDKIKNDVALNVAASYLQILYNLELIKVAEEQLEVTNQQVDRTSKMVDAGRLAKGSLLEIQAQKAQEELDIVNLQNELSSQYLTLTQLLELDSAEGFQIDVPDISVEPEENMILPVHTVYDEALNVLPQVKSAEYTCKSSEKDLLIAKSAVSPSLGLTATYYTGYSDARKLFDPETQDFTQEYSFSDQLKDNQRKTLSLGLWIPIFNNLQNYTAINNAKVGILQSKNNLQLVKNEVYKDIQNARNQAIAAYKKYVATKEALISTEEAFKYSEQKFNVGLITSVEYNTSKNQLIKVKSDLVSAKYEFVFRIKILDFYRGEPLSL